MTGWFDVFGTDDDGAQQKPQQPQGGSWYSNIPGMAGLAPEQQQSLVGLSLLNAAGAMSEAGRPGHGGAMPGLGSILGAGAAGFGNSALQGAQSAARQQQAGKLAEQKAQLDTVKAWQEQQKLGREMNADMARGRYFQGLSPSERMRAEADPESYFKSLNQGLSGEAQNLAAILGRTPTMQELMSYRADTAGTEALARGMNTPQAVQPGATLVIPGMAAGSMGMSAGPRLSVPDLYQPMVASASQQYGVEPQTIAAILQTESNWNPNAVSKKGAVGLGQFMPETAQDMGINPKDPVQSVNATAKYHTQLLQEFGGDSALAHMAYNWGPGNVRNWINSGADPAKIPQETAKYLSRIDALTNGALTGGMSTAAGPAQGGAEALPPGVIYQDTRPTEAQIKRAEAEQQKQDEKASQQKYANVVLEDIGRAKNLAQDYMLIPNTGWGTIGPNVSGSKVSDLEKTLNSIRANVGFERLQEMRRNSPTGGALGAVSEHENRLLQSVLGSLEQSQSEEQFMRNLERLESVYADIVHGPGNWQRNQESGAVAPRTGGPAGERAAAMTELPPGFQLVQ